MDDSKVLEQISRVESHLDILLTMAENNHMFGADSANECLGKMRSLRSLYEFEIREQRKTKEEYTT